MLQQIERQFMRGARPLYAHLVNLFESAIARGDLPSGSRLPPERELAHRLRISRTTVVSAYRELESRGLLRGYVGRGTYVCAAPEPAGTPFAWRGKIASAALRSSDSTRSGIRPTRGSCRSQPVSRRSTASRPPRSSRRSTTR
jgi:DNA-binding FadR family transcriptional regulator